MTDLAPTLDLVDDVTDTWLLTLPLSATGSTVGVNVGVDDLRALGRALRAVRAGVFSTSTVHGDGLDLVLDAQGDGFFVAVQWDGGSVLAVLPLAAVDQLAALVDGAVR